MLEVLVYEDASEPRLLLRGRSRAGLLSRDAATPIARVCGTAAARLTADFINATILRIHLGDGSAVTVPVDRRTMQSPDPLDVCAFR